MCRVFECVKLSSALLWIHELDTSPLWLGFYSFRICSPTGKLLDSVWFMIFMWFSCLSCNCAWISKQTISASGLPQCTAMNQGGREFYIHQSQEAEKWHCLVTRKRLYIQRESRRERREHFADRLCGLGYLRSSNTRYTRCTQAHDFNSDMMWHDYHCCLRSEHMHWQCLWKRRHPAPVDANVNFRSQRNQSDGVWSVCMRSHCNFPSPKLSCQINTPLISRHHTTSILSIRIPLLCRAHRRALRILKSCLTVRCSKVLNRLHLLKLN